MTKFDKSIQAIYAGLPNINCRGLCHRACTRIALSKAEFESIKRNTGHTLRYNLNRTEECSALGNDNRCKIYEYRPLVCRLFGLTPFMKCPFGCMPSKEVSDQDGIILHDMLCNLTPTHQEIDTGKHDERR